MKGVFKMLGLNDYETFKRKVYQILLVAICGWEEKNAL